MKIAAFYSDSPYASWGQSRGFARVLSRMGHQVTEIAIPPVQKIRSDQAERINKPIADHDLLLVSGPEHLGPWIKQFYKGWDGLKIPKVGWYHESFVREDYSLNFEDYKPWLDFHFFPDKDDAAKYKGEFLPLGIDTKMFHPGDLASSATLDYADTHGGPRHCYPERDVPCAFIGLMYPKRERFYREVMKHVRGIDMRVCNGTITVSDLDGINVEKSTELLASQYRRIQVFVTFPSLSNVLVAKILESMASGCALVCPKQPVRMHHHFAYETPEQCAAQILVALEADAHFGELAAEYVRDEHAMELRFEQLFQKVGLAQCVSA
jgi:hypothetical protein